jgi:serine/threonine-protein kinase PpkA
VLIDGDDGETGWRRLRELGSTGAPPIIFMSAVDRAMPAARALKLGAFDYFVKHPTDVALLVKRVQDALRSSPGTIIREGQVAADPAAAFPRLPIAEAGLRVPGYRILGEIAKGAMATVLLAERLEDGLKVALKLLLAGATDDPDGLQRFMREYTLIASLRHPHVVRNYERAFAAHYAYIAIEYFPAGDMSRRMRRGVPTRDALEYLRQIASGLAAVHALGIVHRDLKPRNLLFREDGTLALTDFGVARLQGEARQGTTVVGTPYYMSPEQCSGGTVDGRSDLYSAGILFYQMLTGRKPYTANTLAGLIEAHLRQPIPRLPVGHAGLQPLLDGLLAKDPDDRFQDAGELLTGIEWIAAESS